MTTSVTIDKEKVKDNQTSFENLKCEGIQLVQDLSGETWTDYNTHDPGVTILEQLCYALTDLIYRADFDVEDYLTQNDGNIDFEKQALYAPEQIYTSRPGTLLDYRRLILDAVSELENVWVSAENEGHSGLYKIVLRLTQDMEETSRDEVVEKVRQEFLSNRNLCEDIEAINIVEDVDCHLCARIEVSRGRTAANLLAEIYHSCAQYIAGDIQLHSYRQALDSGQSLEEILRGPFTRHGIFSEQTLTEAQDENAVAEIPISCLFPIINDLEGVDHIKSLYIEKQGKKYYQSVIGESRLAPLRLYYPKKPQDIKVKLFADGKELPISLQELSNRLHELHSKYHSLRRIPQDTTSLYDTPTGIFRNFAQYHSIQHLFPVVYGINAYGVPQSASDGEKARALQLKSYLLIFEQIMANAMAGLDSLDGLFSADNIEQSYYHQVLDTNALPNVDLLYPKNAKEILSRILSAHDNHIDRKNRVLDYLLALYGESFTQKSLRHFNFYYPQEKIDQIIIRNKQAFLKSVVELGKNRGGAFNYCKDAWNSKNVSGLQQRVSLLLGFKQTHYHSLTMEMLKLGMKLLPSHVYRHLEESAYELKFIETEQIDSTFDNVPIVEMKKALNIAELRENLHDVAPLNHYVISEALFRDGINIENYKLGSLTEGEDYQAVIKIKHEQQYWYLASYSDRQKGIDNINQMRLFLNDLNIESEGMHIIEHILLRPKNKCSHDGLSLPKGSDFYSSRISVIFPSWTARCHDEQFRLLAEETVRLNCPAHIYAEFYWLEFNYMYDFETLYEKWLKLKSDSQAGSQELNNAAQKLIVFLIEAGHVTEQHTAVP